MHGGAHMAQDRHSMYKSFNFEVELNGEVISFSKVSGLERNASMQSVLEGGFNNHGHYLRNMQDGEKALALEYGMAGFNSAVSQLLPGRYLPQGVTLRVMDDQFSEPMVTYSLEGCYIRKIVFGDMSAESSGLVINRLEIVYQYITELR